MKYVESISHLLECSILKVLAVDPALRASRTVAE